MNSFGNSLIDLNRTAVEHLRATTKTISKITSPLKNITDYHSVGYFQIHADGKYMYLCDRVDIPEDIYMNVPDQPFEFKESNRLAYINGTHELFWTPTKDHISSKIFELHGVRSSYMFYRKVREDVVESFFIDSENPNMNLANFVLNNRSVLNDFIVYFKERIFDLLENTPEKAFAQFKNVDFAHNKVVEKNGVNIFMDTIKLSKYTFKHKGENYKLTPKQVDVMELLSKGHTAKEIAQIFDISHKTVYNHMECLYKKFGINYKQELISLYKRSDLQKVRGS